jgi:hypothetical protein
MKNSLPEIVITMTSTVMITSISVGFPDVAQRAEVNLKHDMSLLLPLTVMPMTTLLN